jgi:hypothetical protein
MTEKDMKHKSKYDQILHRRENELTLNRFVCFLLGADICKMQEKG